MSRYRTEHEELIYNEGFRDGYNCRRMRSRQLHGCFHIQGRRTGKTNFLVNEFLQDPNNLMIIVLNKTIKLQILRMISERSNIDLKIIDNRIIVVESDRCVELLRGRKADNVFVDEFLVFDKIIQKKLSKILPEITYNIVIRTSDIEYPIDTNLLFRIRQKNKGEMKFDRESLELEHFLNTKFINNILCSVQNSIDYYKTNLLGNPFMTIKFYSVGSINPINIMKSVHT